MVLYIMGKNVDCYQAAARVFREGQDPRDSKSCTGYFLYIDSHIQLIMNS